MESLHPVSPHGYTLCPPHLTTVYGVSAPQGFASGSDISRWADIVCQSSLGEQRLCHRREQHLKFLGIALVFPPTLTASRTPISIVTEIRMTGVRVSDCVCSWASQMGQDEISFKVPCSSKDSACSTRLCVVQLAVGGPLRPKPWSSSIIFEVLPGSRSFGKR